MVCGFEWVDHHIELDGEGSKQFVTGELVINIAITVATRHDQGVVGDLVVRCSIFDSTHRADIIPPRALSFVPRVVLSGLSKVSL